MAHPACAPPAKNGLGKIVLKFNGKRIATIDASQPGVRPDVIDGAGPSGGLNGLKAVRTSWVPSDKQGDAPGLPAALLEYMSRGPADCISPLGDWADEVFASPSASPQREELPIRRRDSAEVPAQLSYQQQLPQRVAVPCPSTLETIKNSKEDAGWWEQQATPGGRSSEGCSTREEALNAASPASVTTDDVGRSAESQRHHRAYTAQPHSSRPAGVPSTLLQPPPRPKAPPPPPVLARKPKVDWLAEEATTLLPAAAPARRENSPAVARAAPRPTTDSQHGNAAIRPRDTAVTQHGRSTKPGQLPAAGAARKSASPAAASRPAHAKPHRQASPAAAGVTHSASSSALRQQGQQQQQGRPLSSKSKTLSGAKRKPSPDAQATPAAKRQPPPPSTGIGIARPSTKPVAKSVEKPARPGSSQGQAAQHRWHGSQPPKAAMQQRPEQPAKLMSQLDRAKPSAGTEQSTGLRQQHHRQSSGASAAAKQQQQQAGTAVPARPPTANSAGTSQHIRALSSSRPVTGSAQRPAPAAAQSAAAVSNSAREGMPIGGFGFGQWHSFREGQVVWAKMQGFPAWPAQVQAPTPEAQLIREHGMSRPVFVVFFGTQDFQWLSAGKLSPWMESYKARARGKDPQLQQAVDAAWWALGGRPAGL